MIETDGDNLGASHIVTGEPAGNAIRVPSLRLQRILDEAGASRVDALKIDVEGYEDRVLTGFFREAPTSLWPGAVVIEHLSRNEWLADCITDMRARGYAEAAGLPLEAVLIGADGAGAAAGLGELGVQTAHVAAHDGLAAHAPQAWGRIVAELIHRLYATQSNKKRVR